MEAREDGVAVPIEGPPTGTQDPVFKRLNSCPYGGGREHDAVALSTVDAGVRFIDRVGPNVSYAVASAGGDQYFRVLAGIGSAPFAEKVDPVAVVDFALLARGVFAVPSQSGVHMHVKVLVVILRGGVRNEPRGGANVVSAA